MKRILAVLALAALAVSVADAKSITTALAQGTLTDSDSLSATADTSDVFPLSANTALFQVVAWCDSVMIYKTQVRPPGSGTWLTVDVDTTAAVVVETTADLGAIYAGWDCRVILDGLWSTGKKVGQAFIHWTN